MWNNEEAGQADGRMRVLSLASLILSMASSSLCAQEVPLDNSALQPFEAHATAVSGQVSRVRDRQPWAVSTGERVPVRQVISTGSDGYAHFTVAEGSYFDIYANSRVIFRQNTARAGDLLDVVAGRVRVHLQPSISQPQQRIFTPAAILSATAPTTVALAIDQDETLRVDVLEGQISVRHAKLPNSTPTEVRALDAILVRPDEPISRRVDRGSLYRYTVRPFKNVWLAVTPGHSNSHSGDVIEGQSQKFLARMTPSHIVSAW